MMYLAAVRFRECAEVSTYKKTLLMVLLEKSLYEY
jgi:hypothetical protein